jgi:glutamine synthetase
VWNDQGIQPLLGASITGYVLQPGSENTWEPISTPSAYLYGTGALADPTGLLYEIMATAESCGLAIESVSTDIDTPQFEIVIPLADAVAAIDSVFLVREMARELANERDLKVTFLPKPLPDRGGNGMQLSMAFLDQAGDNKLFDGDAPDGLSSLARTSIGGILRHHEALTVLAAPTVNSYKRFRGGDIIGMKPTWGYDHRFATVRVPPLRGQTTRLQHRLADAAANPYLVGAALLHAARLGEKSRINPGKSLNDYRDEDGDDGRTVPATLDAGVAALRDDGELSAALGPQLVDNFCQLKMIEWNNFIDSEPRWADKIDEFSEWESATYLPFH